MKLDKEMVQAKRDNKMLRLRAETLT